MSDEPVVPCRITWALDARELTGPEVDLACGTWEGNPDGDVDDWEAGRAVPTPGQVARLAALTGRPESWFRLPQPPGPVHGGAWIRWAKRPRGATFKGRCEYVPPDHVDERGVLHRAGDDPPPETPRQSTLF